MVHLDYRDSRPIYSQIIDRFREQIAAGVLQPGDKLPSVRELAAELAINPNTIQRSYRELELEGWTVSVPGKGCFVSRQSSTLEREKERLFAALGSAAAALRALGVTTAQLAAYLEKEDGQNA